MRRPPILYVQSWKASYRRFIARQSGSAKRSRNVVVDADALNAFEGVADKLNGRGRTVVITPHPGEMARLTGLSTPQIQANRLEVARNFAHEHELIVVLMLDIAL